VSVGSGSTIMYSDDNGESWDVTLNPASLPNSTQLLSVNFIDEQNGYAVANYGKIIRTVDGGDNWELVYDSINESFDTDRADIYIFDAETAIVVGFHRLILKTKDGGINWETILSPEGFYPKAIDFLDADTGFIVGATSSAIILKSTDQGNNWITQDLDLEPVHIYYDIDFISETTGFISAFITGQNTGFVYKTSDSGKTWEQVYSTSSIFYIGEIDFIDGLNGALSVQSSGHNFIYTTDGGLTWEPEYDGIFYPYAPCYSFFYSPEYTIGVGRFGLIGRMYTNTGSWESLYSDGFFKQCKNALFTSNQVGYCQYTAAGGGVLSGYLIKTTNGGKSWYTTFHSIYEGGFDFVNDHYGYVCKMNYDGLIIHKTTNGGQTWEALHNFGDFYSYMDIQPVIVNFLDSLNGIVAFMNKSFITSDGGITWQDMYNFPSDTDWFASVDFLSYDTIFMTNSNGAFPIILKSFDRGLTFSLDTLNINWYFPLKILFTNHTTGYITLSDEFQDSGYIYKTIDGGENWYSTIINDSSNSGYKNIFFTSDDIGYVVGSGEYTTLLKTEDSGETWNPIDISCSSGLSYLYFFDDWHGFVFGDNGVILETYSGGVVGVNENPFVANTPDNLVYPNPAKDFVQIKLDEPLQQYLFVEVFSLKGECLIKKSNPIVVSQNTIRIDLSALPTGIYYCRIKNGNITRISKLIKL
jgi:photosystem II stability/assembly factor-like uncharacterized protein